MLYFVIAKIVFLWINFETKTYS